MEFAGINVVSPTPRIGELADVSIVSEHEHGTPQTITILYQQYMGIIYERRFQSIGSRIHGGQRCVRQLCRPAARIGGVPDIVTGQTGYGAYARFPTTSTFDLTLQAFEAMEAVPFQHVEAHGEALLQGFAEWVLVVRAAPGDRQGGARKKRYAQLGGRVVHPTGV
jgi:hypothetical protein